MASIGTSLVTLLFIAGGCQSARQQPSGAASKPASSNAVLMYGGGIGHEFGRWFFQVDVATFVNKGRFEVDYTEDPATLLSRLPSARALILCNTQPVIDPKLRQAILDFARAGKGIIVLHAAVSRNWDDWPEFYTALVGGVARSQDKFTEYEVTVDAPKHAVMDRVPKAFKVFDELFHFEPDAAGAAVQVLAYGTNAVDSRMYPVVWIVKHPQARIVCISLGHDGPVHDNLGYQRILQNSLRWVSRD